MSSRRKFAALLLLAVMSAAALATCHLVASHKWFVLAPFPLREADRLFDVGIVDANGDGLLDVYTSNHHFRQALLIAEGNGRYRDVISEWGLDQSRQFPLAELSFVAPETQKPGLYIFWHGTQFVIQAHQIAKSNIWYATMRVNDPVEVLKSKGFSVQKRDQQSPVDETTIRLGVESEGVLRLRPGGQGLPITFEFDDKVPLSQIYVGLGRVNPRSKTFVLAMQDRHALAWADYNADGVLDLFINRGALSGTLKAYSHAIAGQIKDELFVSHGKGHYADVGADLGIEKRGCSGRHARWLDVDQDGRIDLFVNCYDRGNIEGSYPKQLYRQGEDGRLHDIAQQIGLALPDEQISGFAWADIDADGDVDLVAYQDKGLVLYRKRALGYMQELVLRRPLGDTKKIGSATDSESYYEGKLTVADYDADGDPDVFSASARENILLVNDGGTLLVTHAASLGLPRRSIAGTWVDYDNDGLQDLYFVPQGLFHQKPSGHFERTGELELTPGEYDAAIINWFDSDNDGRVDLLAALHKTPGFRRWWEFKKADGHEGSWLLLHHRNVGPAAHWLQVVLRGAPGNGEGIGSRVTVVTPDGPQVQEMGSTDGAHFSQGQYRLYFGLGSHAKANAITVQWSDGHKQEMKDVSGDRVLSIERRPTAGGRETK
jgi:hypothetical protein